MVKENLKEMGIEEQKIIYFKMQDVKTEDVRKTLESMDKWKNLYCSLPESGINGILEFIKNINTQDEFYKKFSPGNIRKWLFRFLLKENPLQDVLVLMNIPISNISNYISDEEMIEFTTDKLSKGKKYLLEDFMNDVEKLL